MKKKYFFGIFICLILLCSGVFLLTLESNQKIKIAPANNQTVTLNVYFYGTYPYTGITGNVMVSTLPLSLGGSFSNYQETNSSRKLEYTGTRTMPTNSVLGILVGKIEFDSNSLYNPGNGCNARRILRTKVYVTCDGNRVYTNEDYNWIDDNILTNVTNVSNVVVDIKIYFETFITINWNNPSGGVNSNGCNTSVIFNAEANQFQLYNSDQSLRNVSSLSPLPTRSNYAFSGYYPSGASSNDLVVDKNGKVIYAGSHTFCEKIRLTPLIPKWTPVYHIDTNILSPSNEQDSKSGTMIQSYNGQTSNVTTDQVYSSIKADTTLTIKDINPATGMYVSSITVDKGSVSITKDKEGNITGCTYTPRSSILGNPVGGGGWDATISINMDYKDYDVTIKDGDEAVSNLADMTWISGATFNGTTYTYNTLGITSTYNTATGDFKINGTPTNSFSILTCLGLTLKQNEQYKLEVTPKSGSMLSWQNNGYFVFEVCDKNGNNFSTNRQFLDLTGINSTTAGKTFSSTMTISANSASNGAGLRLWYYHAGKPASQMFTNYTINIKITKVGSTQNVNKKVKATYNLSMRPVPVPSRPGYSFEGYYDGDTQYYNANGASARNWDKDSTATLNAKWTSYRLTYSFNSDGGSSHTGGTAYYGGTITLPTPTKTGYTFIGWKHNNNNKVYPAGGYSVNSDIANGSATVIFIAQWQANKYEVEFNKNSNQAVGSMSNQSFTFDTAQNLSANKFTRVGYKFLGWSRDANATTAEYQDKTSVKNLSETRNSIVTLYAIWKISENTLTINLDGGTFNKSLLNNNYTPALQSYQMTLLQTPVKTGYIFNGWEIEGDAKVELAQYYLSAKSFDGKDDYQALGREYMYLDKITINLFGYMDNWGEYAPDQRLISCTEAGGWDLAFYNSEYICAEFYQQGKGYNNAKVDAKWSSITKGWHMFTMVFDKDYAYLYIDGKLRGQSEKYTDILGYNSTNGIFIGAEASTSATTPIGKYFKGSIQNVLITNDYITGIKDIYSEKFSIEDNLNNNYVLIMGSGDCTIKAKWKKTEVSTSTREEEINEKFTSSYTINISSEQDLYDLAYYSERNEIGSNYTFIQTTNITLTSTWLPIGRLKSFTATYDGQGCSINGLVTDNSIMNKNNEYLEENSGLFANASGAKIKNVIIENATIYGQNAGIIAGSGSSTTAISGCIVSGNVNGTNKGSIIGNGGGVKISVCLAKGVNTASFASGSASIDSCIYELTDGTKGKSSTFNKYNEWIYPSNFAHPMPKAFMWYPYPELTKDSLNSWMG